MMRPACLPGLIAQSDHVLLEVQLVGQNALVVAVLLHLRVALPARLGRQALAVLGSYLYYYRRLQLLLLPLCSWYVDDILELGEVAE